MSDNPPSQPFLNLMAHKGPLPIQRPIGLGAIIEWNLGPQHLLHFPPPTMSLFYIYIYMRVGVTLGRGGERLLLTRWSRGERPEKKGKDDVLADVRWRPFVVRHRRPVSHGRRHRRPRWQRLGPERRLPSGILPFASPSSFAWLSCPSF